MDDRIEDYEDRLKMIEDGTGGSLLPWKSHQPDEQPEHVVDAAVLDGQG